MLPYWKRESIEVEVVNMLEDYLGFVSYPLDIDHLIDKLQVTLKPYPFDNSFEHHCCLSASSDAFSLLTPAFDYAEIRFNPISYKDSRILFSKAHEIAHIYLEQCDDLGKQEEDEADYFAGYLLAPHPLIGHYHLEDRIADTFGVGNWCADIAYSQYCERCRMGGPIKEHEVRLLQIAHLKALEVSTLSY